MEGPIGNVIHRLERHIGPERAVFERTERIASMADIFTKDHVLAQKTLKTAFDDFSTHKNTRPSYEKKLIDVQKWKHFYRELDKKGGEKTLEITPNPEINVNDIEIGKAESFIKEGLQTVMSAYLFSENKRIFFERTHSLNNYNLELEKKQMESVARGLLGQHQQIDTGQGKTSVILPITTLIQAYTSPEKKVIFSADSGLRTEEFERFVKPLATALAEAGLEKVEIGSKKDEVIVGRDRKKQLKKQMELRSIMDTSFSEEHPAEIVKLRHDTEIQVDIDRQLQKSIIRIQQKDKKQSPQIEISTHDNLVHEFQQSSINSKDKKISIYMDEAHAPFDRGSPYEVTSDENLVFSPSQCRQASAEWILHYVVGHYMETKDTLLQGGTGTLSQKGEKKFRDIKITEIVNPNGRLFDLFSEAVRHIAKEYNLDKKGELTLQGNLIHDISDLVRPHDKRTSETKKFSDYMSAIAEKTAHIYREKDELFIINDEGKYTLRDGYQDELLSTHEYDRDMSLAARGILGSFKMLLPRTASSSITYSTFLHSAKDQVVCYSGTLIDEGKKTDFATFLEEETKRNIHTIENNQRKILPEPYLSESRNKAEENLIEAITKDSRGILLVSTESIEKVKHSAELLKKRFGEDLVHFIGSKPSGDIQKERAYDIAVQNSLQLLAEGKIKAVVSTGSVGVGMNIVKADGSFPDIKIGLLGVPNSKLQLKQIIGRRRASASMDKQDYYWHLSEDQLEKYISMYPDKTNNPLSKIFFNQEDNEIIRKQLDDVKLRPKELQQYIFKLILRGHHNIDTKYDKDYDKYFNTISCDFQNIVIEEVLKRKFGGKTLNILSAKDQFILQNTVASIGVPSSMYQDLQKLPVLMPLQIDNNLKDRIVTLNKHVRNSNFVERNALEWMSEMYDTASNYVKNRFSDEELDMFYKDGYENGRIVFLDTMQDIALDTVPGLTHLTVKGGNISPDLATIPWSGMTSNFLTVLKGNTAFSTVRDLDMNVIMFPSNTVKTVAFDRFPVAMTNGAQPYILSRKLESISSLSP